MLVPRLVGNVSCEVCALICLVAWQSQYDKLLGVSLRVAVSTAAAVMLTAEDADQAARNIDLELLGHVTSALKSYLIKVRLPHFLWQIDAREQE
jgi:hypothetical protein